MNRCCETCGNKACLNMIVAVYYDYCLENGYKLWKPKTEQKEEKMTHKIKLSKFYADVVLSGQKNFEIRYNDRGYQRGDKVQFVVMDGAFHEDHPLENETYLITYLVHGYGLKKDWCVFGIKPLKKQEEEDEL